MLFLSFDFGRGMGVRSDENKYLEAGMPGDGVYLIGWQKGVALEGWISLFRMGQQGETLYIIRLNG
ncbi:MAG: hypothetical protein EI684_12665 [Candidatus Viridilinea halotolerans]|uniref:Uncharacterized protein n=1 Tax=Candidatus Viridilinea halotolerans TaxID=2491704 RepID=A0A426TY39_9CHLR|nr:MAG: hypothetical protein EI684_12665 [Candidatus Viridilinea halotolerans]